MTIAQETVDRFLYSTPSRTFSIDYYKACILRGGSFRPLLEVAGELRPMPQPSSDVVTFRRYSP